MPKYLLTYSGGGMPESETEQAQVMAAWEAWFGQLGDSVEDGGNPIGVSKTISPDGSVADTTGAPLSGFSIISAGNIDEAVAKAKGCPVLTSGGAVQVGETFEIEVPA